MNVATLIPGSQQLCLFSCRLHTLWEKEQLEEARRRGLKSRAQLGCESVSVCMRELEAMKALGRLSGTAGSQGGHG